MLAHFTSMPLILEKLCSYIPQIALSKYKTYSRNDHMVAEFATNIAFDIMY